MEKKLSEKLKEVGLVIGERHLIMAIDDVYEVAEILAAHTDSAVDDLFVQGLKTMKSEIKEFADKLAPEVDSHQE